MTEHPLGRSADALEPDTEETEAVRILSRIRSALMEHPTATQAAFSALVAEGRRFEATPEGARLAEALAGSELLHRGRMLWEVITSSAFVEDGDGLPSVLVDELARLVATGSLEPLLSRVFENEQ